MAPFLSANYNIGLAGGYSRFRHALHKPEALARQVAGDSAPLKRYMRVLLSGASGFIGGHVLARLLNEGHPVRVLTRRSGLDKVAPFSRCEVVVADLRRPVPSALAEDVDCLIHAAGVVGDGSDRRRFFSTNVAGTRHLLDVMSPSARLIHISSLAVITGLQHHHGTDETADYIPTGEPYTDSKIAAEKLILEHPGCHSAVILRPGFVYGPGDRLLLPAVIGNLQRSSVRLIDGGRHRMNLTYVGNLVDAIMLAFESEDAKAGIFNITDDEPVTKKEFFFTVADLLGIDRPTRTVSLAQARLACTVLEPLYRILRISSPPVSKAKLRFAGLSQFFDVTKARTILGYRPAVAFQEGIRVALAERSGDDAMAVTPVYGGGS